MIPPAAGGVRVYNRAHPYRAVSSPAARYRVLESLGKGGMGEVFLADDTQLERKVALKFLPEELEEDPVARQRFEREAKSAAALDHPYICKIHEIAEVDGKTCIVMEHVAGQTLDQVLAEGALEPSRALEIAAEVVEALEQAHARRVLHRDLKPSNLMLTPEGHVKVMDFGLAKRLREPGATESQVATHDTLTGMGAFIGTPAYMAPEQIRGGEADTRSDVFSFGIVLYELLEGTHPFRKDTTSDTLAAILRDPPSPTSKADPTTYVIFEKLLAKQADDRYESFAVVHAEIRRLRGSNAGSSLAPVTGTAALPSTGRRTPYVGRETEQAELNHLVDQAIRGRGGLMLIGGEPGVGKTRLVEQILAHAHDQRCLTLTGRCYESDGTAPFMPFVEIVEECMGSIPAKSLRESLSDAAPEIARLVPSLRRHFPDIPASLGLPPEQQRHYLFKNYAAFIARASRTHPLVILLDDLQWADDATAQLLQHLALEFAQAPILVFGTYRDVELSTEQPFAKALETLSRKRLAQTLTVAPLPPDSVRLMLSELGGPSPPNALVQSIHRETEGNPFFVEEVFQHLKDEGALYDHEGRWRSDREADELGMPEGVRAVIARRLGRVSEDSQRVLTVAAIVGRGFSLELLEAIGDVTGEALLTALEEAEAHFLIVSTSNREAQWEFSHALIRQTLADGLSVPRRQRIHVRVAEAIEHIAGDAVDAHASDLAHHYYQAGAIADTAKTVRYLMAAGERGLRSGALTEALRGFDQALSLLPAEDRPGRATVIWKRGVARRNLGRWEDALDDWKTVLSIREEFGDRLTVARACTSLAALLGWMARGPEALDFAQRGLKAVGPQVSIDRCRLLAAGATAVGVSAERADALVTADAMHAESIAMATALGDAPTRGVTLMVRGYTHFHSMRSTEQLAAAAEAVEVLRAAGEQWVLADALAQVETASVRLGHLGEMGQDRSEAERLAQRLGHRGAEMYSVLAHGQRDWLVDADLDQFEAWVRRVIEVSDTSGMPWGAGYRGWLAMTSVWRGQWQEARTRAEDAVDQESSCFWVGLNWSLLFLCECLLGHKTTVLALLEDGRRRLPSAGQPNTTGAWTMLLGVIEGLATVGEREAAGELYPLAIEAIDTGTVVSADTRHLLQTVAGISAAAAGNWEQAEAHYQTALRQAHEIPFRSEQPEVRRWYAQMLLDRNQAGDRDKALTLLGEAIGQYRTIGMPKHLAMAEGMLGRAR